MNIPAGSHITRGKFAKDGGWFSKKLFESTLVIVTFVSLFL